jgi:hypothetical protein
MPVIMIMCVIVIVVMMVVVVRVAMIVFARMVVNVPGIVQMANDAAPHFVDFASFEVRDGRLGSIGTPAIGAHDSFPF